MAGNRFKLLMGAVAGAIIVATLVIVFRELLRDLAHPAVVVVFAAFGAVMGAYAAGAVAYDGERITADPDSSYRVGALAEREADELPVG